MIATKSWPCQLRREYIWYNNKAYRNQLIDNEQIVFRYSGCEGEVTGLYNPNGSVDNIAGIVNENKNVMGLMPHPERCADPAWPTLDGQLIFKSMIQSLQPGILL